MNEESNFARERARECLQNNFNINLEADDTITTNRRVLRIHNEYGQNMLDESLTYVAGFNIVRENTIVSIDIRLNPIHHLMSNRVLERYINMQLGQELFSRFAIDKNKLKKIKSRRIKRNEPKKECPICLCLVKYKQLARPLPCKHVFHTKCIDKWLLNTSNSCPVCRYVIEDT